MTTRRDFLRLGAAGLFGLPACTGLNLATAGATGSAPNWSKSQLEAAGAIAKRNGGRGWAAWSGHSQLTGWQESERGQILSITKSLGGLAAVRAYQEGWLSPDEMASATLHEWQRDPRKSRITVLMLLQQTAGLDPSGSALYHGVIADKGAVAISRPAVDEPGLQFRYGPVCWETLAELMQRKLSKRGENLESFLYRAVMRPIGLSSPNWRADRRQRFYLSTGAELTVSEMGRLGRTLGQLLHGESTNGFEARHFSEMTRVSGANPMFGAGIWRNSSAIRADSSAIEVESALDPARSPLFWRQSCLSKRQPPSMAALIGSSGRRVFIWPEAGRIVVRHGVSSAWQDQPFLNALG